MKKRNEPKQLWRCRRCDWEYGSATDATAVFCAAGHRMKKVWDHKEDPDRMVKAS